MSTLSRLMPLPGPFGGDEPLLETELYRVIDGEGLLRGPRGLTSLSVSVRFLEVVEVWIYAADMVTHGPTRGLWRWTPDVWEFLGGTARSTDPAALIRRALSESAWVRLPIVAAERERLLRVLRLVTAPPSALSS